MKADVDPRPIGTTVRAVSSLIMFKVTAELGGT